MSLYRIDPLHPDRLRCELCGATVAALPDDGAAPPGALTAGQAAALWPDLAADVAGHDAACSQDAGDGTPILGTHGVFGTAPAVKGSHHGPMR